MINFNKIKLCYQYNVEYIFIFGDRYMFQFLIYFSSIFTMIFCFDKINFDLIFISNIFYHFKKIFKT